MTMRKINLCVVTSDEMPDSVHACVCKDQTDNESYIIMVNSNQTPAEQEESFLHECFHLWRGHLSDDHLDVAKIESETHQRIAEIKGALV